MTPGSLRMEIVPMYFNPHLPQEMTQQIEAALYMNLIFQSTSPAGDDSLQQYWKVHFIQFQSTSPAGDDSAAQKAKMGVDDISIHISRRR